jgi:hypothetical protein
MADLWDYHQRWRRWWRRWHQHMTDGLQAWRDRRAEAQAHRRCMDEQRHQEAQRRALTRTLLKELDGSYVDLLRQEVREQHRDEDYARVLAQVREEQRAHLEAMEERLKDRYAERQRLLQRELDRQEDAIETRLRKEITEEVATDVEGLQRSRERLRQQRDLSDSVVVELLRQLCPDGQHEFLHDFGVQRLRMHAINDVLKRSRLRLRARLREGSSRIVACEIEPGKGQARHIFWLDKTAVEGVIDEDEDAGAALPEEPTEPIVRTWAELHAAGATLNAMSEAFEDGPTV